MTNSSTTFMVIGSVGAIFGLLPNNDLPDFGQLAELIRERRPPKHAHRDRQRCDARNGFRASRNEQRRPKTSGQHDKRSRIATQSAPR